MVTVKTSKAFDDAGQSETQWWVGSVRQKYDTPSPHSLGAVPETLRRSAPAKKNSVRDRIASRLGRALKKK
jgi:hypothetical protein